MVLHADMIFKTFIVDSDSSRSNQDDDDIYSERKSYHAAGSKAETETLNCQSLGFILESSRSNRSLIEA